MSNLEDILPREHRRVMDLVSEAGIDVSDWQNFKGGAEKAASNPKYCYEWSFEDPKKKVIVLNLWYEKMRDQGGAVVYRFNVRKLSENPDRIPGAGVRKNRALKMDFAIQKAIRESLSIRVIVCDGQTTEAVGSNKTTRRAENRLLDPEPWIVSSYDSNTGACLLTRGSDLPRYCDQFDIQGNIDSPPEKRSVSGQAFVRSSEIRKRVLIRAKGNCEWCGQPGFQVPDGSMFLETHHIIQLSEGGYDIESNVAALCPNHHREAHYGRDRAALRQTLIQRSGESNTEQTD